MGTNTSADVACGLSLKYILLVSARPGPSPAYLSALMLFAVAKDKQELNIHSSGYAPSSKESEQEKEERRGEADIRKRDKGEKGGGQQWRKEKDEPIRHSIRLNEKYSATVKIALWQGKPFPSALFLFLPSQNIIPPSLSHPRKVRDAMRRGDVVVHYSRPICDRSRDCARD